MGFEGGKGGGAPGSPSCGRDASSSSSQRTRKQKVETNRPIHHAFYRCWVTVTMEEEMLRPFPRPLPGTCSQADAAVERKEKGEADGTHSRISFGEGSGLGLVPLYLPPAYRSACASNERSIPPSFRLSLSRHARVRQLQIQ